MSRARNIVMLGASGAVGGQALKRLLAEPDAKVLSLGRRRLDLDVPNLEQQVVDVLKPETYQSFLSGHDAALCALGVGQPTKMSREEFVRVDRDVVLDFGRACKAAGIRHFSILGAVGANAKSKFLYVRLKGEIEDGLAALGFESLSFFEPSMILTPTNRYGWSQGVTLALWPWVDKLLHGSWRKFRGVKVETLGRAMPWMPCSPSQACGV